MHYRRIIMLTRRLLYTESAGTGRFEQQYDETYVSLQIRVSIQLISPMYGRGLVNLLPSSKYTRL